MKVVFASNYMSHHQKPFSDHMYEITNGDYFFVATKEISDERKKMGWKSENLPYVVQYSENREFCEELIDNVDVVIIGSAPLELVNNRLKNNKLTFRYSERIFKNKFSILKWPRWYLSFRSLYNKYDSYYLLCASAYAASDYGKLFSFLNKTFKWGYFPEKNTYPNILKLLERKTPNSILWVARLIELKHPEIPILVAKYLKKKGIQFTLTIIGEGPLDKSVKKMIKQEGLTDCINLLGFMSPGEVRAIMEKNEIFLFTSDRNEGWGAVLNEAMNSACAVVASHAVGSVPFLIDNFQNGIVYKCGNIADVSKKVEWLLKNDSKRKEIAQQAYYTIAQEWNAENAASKFVELSKNLLEGNLVVVETGVCSQAPRITMNSIKRQL